MREIIGAQNYMKIEHEKDKAFVQALKEAARKAFIDLLNAHSDEHFYYCTLVMMNAQGYPIISAMSDEALEKVLQEYKEKYGWAPENNRKMLKWSFADSPYCAYGEQYFTDVQKMIDERDLDIGDDEEDDEKFMEEYEFRMDSMEKVMSDLDKEGVFGSGEKRKNIVVAAEVMPPEYTNTERVLRLNSREKLKEWLEEAAELEEE